MKKKICSLVLVTTILAIASVGCSSEATDTTSAEINTMETESNTETQETFENTIIEETTAYASNEESVYEQPQENTETTDRVATETGKGTINLYFGGDPTQEDLWATHNEDIYLLLKDSNNDIIVKEKLAASESTMASLSTALLEQISLEDAKVFFETHESEAVNSSKDIQVYSIDVTDSFNDTVSFVYNENDITLDIDKVYAEVITYMYPVDSNEDTTFYTEGYQMWYGDSEYYIYAGGVEYSLRGTYYNYGKAAIE